MNTAELLHIRHLLVEGNYSEVMRLVQERINEQNTKIHASKKEQ